MRVRVSPSACSTELSKIKIGINYVKKLTAFIIKYSYIFLCHKSLKLDDIKCEVLSVSIVLAKNQKDFNRL